ncbi:TetR/AcrR family transcriptional regulator [Streptomyces sp. NBC_01476]|uniref:TetR/AcrR family transcriptional regulator n=1 Tax=Streptomyces sp. NBC_01476 TaxID=2903881 RepID=UPI002E372686|nr:TetR/AcrR family transcriptional regulator [Streptomyces sp. NBC_01476]
MTAKRAYVSPLREKSAARTRELILTRATALFAERGYGRVTVADIAAAAGVAPKTVFASAGSKAEILDRIVDRAVAESGHEAAVAHTLQLDTPAEVLRSTAHGTRLGNERQFTTHEAIRKALPVHESGVALWERATAAYRHSLNVIADHLQTLTPGPLSPAPQKTGDLLWLWFGPAAWRTLVMDCGWSWDYAEATLAHTALAALTPAGAPPGPGPQTADSEGP